MADLVIFPEQTVQFKATEQPGAVYRVIAPSPFVLVLGETYRVVLDGIAHVSTCVEFEGAPCITNAEDLSSEEMPPDGTFVIQYIPADEISSDDAAFVMVNDSSNSTLRTLAIYQTAAVSNDVITENWDGSTEVHPGVESVSLETEDGGEKEFILADLVPETVEKTVALDFSGGDMIVTPKKGQAFSSILIPKPDNLIPENVPEGMNMAGIIGAMAAGGSAKIGVGEFRGTGAAVVVEHTLGCVPDVVAIVPSIEFGGTDSKKSIFQAFGVSAAFGSKFSIAQGYASLVCKLISSTTYSLMRDGGKIDSQNAENTAIWKANNETVQFGNDNWATSTRYYYTWLAIGGLA